MDGIDGSPEIGTAKISKGLEGRLVPFVKQTSIGDEDDIALRESIRRIKVFLPFNEVKGFMGIEHLQDALDPDQGRPGNRIRIENLQPLKDAISRTMGQLKERPGEIRLRIVSRSCRIKIH